MPHGEPPRRYACITTSRTEPFDGLPRKLLGGYTGFLQTDAFRVYKIVAGEEPGITLVGCWAHVRCRFFEATKGSSKAGAAHEGLGFVTALSRIQNEPCALNLSDDEFLRRRQEATEPHLEKFRTWLTRKSEAVIPQSLLGKAVAYTLAEWEALVRYLYYQFSKAPPFEDEDGWTISCRAVWAPETLKCSS